MADEVALEWRPSAPDHRALHRWAITRPGPDRRRTVGFLVFLVLASVFCVQANPRFGLLAVVVMWACPVGGHWQYGVAAARQNRSGGPRTVHISRQGFRIAGATSVEIAWAATKAVELTATHLFVRHGVVGYVVPLDGISAEDRGRLEQLVPTDRGGASRAVPAPASPQAPAGDALVVRWTSTRADSYQLQRFALRVTPGIRARMWRRLAAIGLVLAVASVVLWPDAGIGFALYWMVLFGVVLPLGGARLLAWSVARRIVHGPCEARIDATGVSATTPTTEWHADWEAIAAWGPSGEDLCILTTTGSGLVIPVAAIPDRRPLTARFAERVGRPGQMHLPAERVGLPGPVGSGDAQ